VGLRRQRLGAGLAGGARLVAAQQRGAEQAAAAALLAGPRRWAWPKGQTREMG